MRNLLDDWDLSTWALAIVVSIAGGLVNWLSRLKKWDAKSFNIIETFGKLFISTAIGIGSFMVIDALGQPIGVCAGVAGFVGYMGKRFLFAVEKSYESFLPFIGKSKE